jgi:hypothetical protein
MTVNKESLRYAATLSVCAGTLKLEYAGEAVMCPFPTNAYTMSRELDLLLDKLVDRVDKVLVRVIAVEPRDANEVL